MTIPDTSPKRPFLSVLESLRAGVTMRIYMSNAYLLFSPGSISPSSHSSSRVPRKPLLCSLSSCFGGTELRSQIPNSECFTQAWT